MYFHDLTGTCAHLSYDNATVQLLEEALMESDQHVVKAAFLVEIEAVGSCCIFLGTWMLYPEPDTAVIETTWVLLWILEHGNLSGWRVVASGFWRLMLPHLLIVQVHGIEWGYLSLKSRENLVASGWKLVVSGWRWSPWIVEHMRSFIWLAYYKALQQHTAAVHVLVLCFGHVKDGTKTFWTLEGKRGVSIFGSTQLRKEQAVKILKVASSKHQFVGIPCGLFYASVFSNSWCIRLLVMLAPDKSRSSSFFYP